MKETRFPGIFSSKIFLFFLLVILLILGSSLGREFYRKYRLQKEFDSLKLEIDKLENKNQDLASMLEYLNKESNLEKEARRRLNLKKPGENVVVIVPPESEPRPENKSSADNPSPDSKPESKIADVSGEPKNRNLSKWWNYFFGE
ncbi:MAG: Cell division protein FtsL [Candidatus Azambacteria bacterium GW2011_GWA2_45_90]|uniref:Cell division protein FtsL n=1 Tax=Candidatus Azambacteria bacterium GW2011_GWA2_45_90 TaxID=1618614 RepID=A0A0G1NF36_9BACT|nr:MAG: Cell division protein FtsL [Candidatus Azambacteria bacterium GW2011_GWA2_45_90]